jgi:hypothetical protein
VTAMRPKQGVLIQNGKAQYNRPPSLAKPWPVLENFYRGSLLLFHDNTAILCYKAILLW